ncbi:MAG: 5-(carboxyamino)imidazole ribonucleotide mutase [Candidatus Paceibacterota bacterium]|jgi:5-(carboxyamino)imidazole ribonucleotide mutase
MKKSPQVAIIMGSDSDLEIMSEAGKVFDDFDLPYEITVISAHRSPELAHKYAKEAKGRGIKVIIAGAGGSAHLAGVLASFTTLPVIGIPIKAKTLDGLDSLLSTVQMPPGVPVATVGINGSKNGALLALQILSLKDISIEKKLERYKKKIDSEVKLKGEKLLKIGYKKYFDEKNKKK